MRIQTVFLDRDGVINQERSDYVKSWDEFRILPGVLDALHRLAQLNVPIIIITNQSAIGRGAATQETVDNIHQRLSELVTETGGKIDDVFLCPHRPDEDCGCRKPKPGLLLQAAAKYQLKLEQTVFVGDSVTDYQAAVAAQAHSILVKTGRQAQQLESLVESYLQTNHQAVRPEIVDNLSVAVERIISNRTK
ncbi:MAG: D-glycero-beta-D-manno-heptose 1,7-bisphosphate 7-phosphatase [Caldilineaceae bacterium]